MFADFTSQDHWIFKILGDEIDGTNLFVGFFDTSWLIVNPFVDSLATILTRWIKVGAIPAVSNNATGRNLSDVCFMRYLNNEYFLLLFNGFQEWLHVINSN